jgi:hypothetical protein
MFLRAWAMALEIATGTSRALPKPKPTRPGAVADHGERGEAELPAALDHLGGAVDRDQLFEQVVGRLGFSILAICLQTLWLELETRFASGLGQRLDAPVVLKPERSNATFAMPFALARSAIARPTALAASMLPVVFNARARPSAPSTRRPAPCRPRRRTICA